MEKIQILIIAIFLSSCSDNRVWYDMEVVNEIRPFRNTNTTFSEYDLISLKNSDVELVVPHGKYQVRDTIKFK